MVDVYVSLTVMVSSGMFMTCLVPACDWFSADLNCLNKVVYSNVEMVIVYTG